MHEVSKNWNGTLFHSFDIAIWGKLLKKVKGKTKSSKNFQFPVTLLWHQRSQSGSNNEQFHLQLLLNGSTNTGHGQKVCCVSQHSVNMSSTWSRYQETGPVHQSEDGSRQARAQQQDQAIIVFMRGGKREAPPECNNTVYTRQSKTAQHPKQTRCPETSALYFSIDTNTYMSKPPKKQQTSWLAVISKPPLTETENHRQKKKQIPNC